MFSCLSTRLLSYSVAMCLSALLLTLPAQSQPKSQPPLDFMTGADLSFLPHYEQKGVRYFDQGKADNLLNIAKRNGWKMVRVRLWHTPEDTPQYQVSNLQNVALLGQRIKAAGLGFMLDIHYSDTWADPGNQKKPADWDKLPFPQLLERVEEYSRLVMMHLWENEAVPDIVQIGNETKNGFMYGSDANGVGPQPGGGFWEPDKGGIERFLRLFAAGVKGVNEARFDVHPQIMLHIPDGQDTAFVKWYFSTLEATARNAKPPSQFNYDIVGLSYYPGNPWDRKAGYEPWHLSHLTDSMNYIATTLGKPVMVVETNWPHAGQPQPMPGTPEYAFTPEGQADFYRDLIRAVRKVPQGRGKGVMAWEMDTLNWDSIFDEKGNALPAVRALGQN